MQPTLPEYRPPQRLRLAVAAALAPGLVVLACVAVLVRWMDVDTASAICTACAVWVLYERFAYQSTLGHYNEDYVFRHLAWRRSEDLLAMAGQPGTAESTRRFVSRFVDTERLLLRHGQLR